jgi:hypothetical protein
MQVLLNNSVSLLPLNVSKLKSVAVVGPLANCTRQNSCSHAGGGVEMGGKVRWQTAVSRQCIAMADSWTDQGVL